MDSSNLFDSSQSPITLSLIFPQKRSFKQAIVVQIRWIKRLLEEIQSYSFKIGGNISFLNNALTVSLIQPSVIFLANWVRSSPQMIQLISQKMQSLFQGLTTLNCSQITSQDTAPMSFNGLTKTVCNHQQISVLWFYTCFAIWSKQSNNWSSMPLSPKRISSF